RILGISYPTVRGRLDGVIAALGLEARAQEEQDGEDEARKRQQILEALDKGELSPQEAIKRMKHIKQWKETADADEGDQ
ncbi:MAG: DUF2089 family protein, partial [Limnochordia bacterium]